MGLLTIAALGSDQQAPRCASGAALLVKGQDFIARFTPTQPAINSTSSVPDTPSPSMGKGRFIPKQSFATAG
jgi:hypothetical protein